MRDKELYKQILGIRSPWQVADVELSVGAGEVKVYVEQAPGAEQHCPKCGKLCCGYDSRRRQWRHLDTCQYKTILVADVPRVECEEHGVVTVCVPWAEPGSGFTSLFEALVIDWLKEASTLAVSRLMKRAGTRLTASCSVLLSGVCRAGRKSVWRTWVLTRRHSGSAMTT